MVTSKAFSQVYLIFLLLPLTFIATTYGQNASITIPLNKNLTWVDKELYGGFVTLNATSTLKVDFTEPDKSVSFIIFQVHSHLHNVTLYNNTLARNSVVVGTNIGLYSSVKPVLDTFYVYNQNDVDLKLYITVHGYDEFDPIPGGCNMEFPTAISPYMQTLYMEDYVLVDLAPAKGSKDANCKSLDDVNVVFYVMYLHKRFGTNMDTYFTGIQSISTLDEIVKNGDIIPDNGEHMRRRHATYYGMPVMYVAVAYSNTNKSAYSIYIPNVVYHCSNPLEDQCSRWNDPVAILMYISLICIGFVMCFYGHYFFKAEMFLVGTLSGVLVTYIVISLIAAVEPSALLGVSLLSGLGFGAIWLLFWWFYGIPLFSIFLPALNVGFLIASVIYFALPGGLVILQSDLNFWTLFIMITLMTSLLLVSMTFLTNVLCCAILGSYTFVFSTSYIARGNLSYIIVNAVRRAVVPKYNKVILAPPFQLYEWLDVFAWVLMVVTGSVVGYLLNRGRPPFPPPPRSVRPSMPGLSYGAINQENRRRNGRTTPKNAANNETAPLLT